MLFLDVRRMLKLRPCAGNFRHPTRNHLVLISLRRGEAQTLCFDILNEKQGEGVPPAS